jgi:DNA-binding GntR family transcriptional regulator
MSRATRREHFKCLIADDVARNDADAGRTPLVRNGTVSVRAMEEDTMNDGADRSLAAGVYAHIKDDIFEFRLMPGQRFSENEIAARLGVSRTPVRQALYRLEHEGYIVVESKSGWTVRAFDFHAFEELYDVRLVLELAAVRRLCELDPMPSLAELKDVWLVPPEDRLTDVREIGRADEAFHATVVAAAGNAELARMHRDVAERIRVVRRLEFGVAERIRQTYAEHAQILRAVLRRKSEQAQMLLKAHVEVAKAEVRKITLHKLATVRQEAAAAAPAPRRGRGPRG